ncbi:hypothetical protein V5O48_017855, partial [Marasmius crinis-equi]
WADPSSPPISPAVINFETALPPPDPPAHLYLDSAIQAALAAYGSLHIKVDSPFNVSAFLNLLHRHVNLPLIDSVEKGFHFSFWPYDDGDWKIEPNRFTDNYTSDKRDLSASCEYAAKERDKAHWSPEILDLLPGMVVSPMFVVWQGKGATKPMRHAKLSHPGKSFVCFKSDVQGAFLNLPAHPLWQLRQVVVVDGKFFTVRRIMLGTRVSP